MLLRIIVATVSLSASLSGIADENKIATAIDFLKTACASGEKIEIKAKGDGGLSLIKKGVQGEIYFSKTEARGVADGLSSEMQGKNLESVRECMKPYISKILDAILGGGSESGNKSSAKDDVIRLAIEKDLEIRNRMQEIRFLPTTSPACSTYGQMTMMILSPQEPNARSLPDDIPVAYALDTKARIIDNAEARKRMLATLISDGSKNGCLVVRGR